MWFNQKIVVPIQTTSIYLVYYKEVFMMICTKYHTIFFIVNLNKELNILAWTHLTSWNEPQGREREGQPTSFVG